MSEPNDRGRRDRRRPRYHAYLLRMWETVDGDRHIWRASLERPGTGERRGFETLADLARFLEGEAEGEEA